MAEETVMVKAMVMCNGAEGRAKRLSIVPIGLTLPIVCASPKTAAHQSPRLVCKADCPLLQDSYSVGTLYSVLSEEVMF